MIKKVVMVCFVLMLVTVLAGVAGDMQTNSPSNQSTASAPTNLQFQSYTGPFVGSKNSNVYHYPWCSEAKKILPQNLVTFATLADACAAGYRPCEVCKPPACGSLQTFIASPAVCAQGPNSLDLFAQGTNGALYHKSYAGSTWSSWENLGGKLTSSPAATSPGSGQIDVFVRGSNGALYEKTTTDGGKLWSNWISLGGQIPVGTAPAASSWDSGRLDLFVEGMNGALYHKSYTGSTWSSWENLGGKLTSSPGAAGLGEAQTIRVGARGGDGAYWYREFENGVWSGWNTLGGKLLAGTGPALAWVQTGDNSFWLRDFVTGTNHQLYYSNGPWVSLGGYLTSSPTAASPIETTYYGDINVFVRGGDGGIWGKLTNNNGASWTGWYGVAW